MKSLIVKWKMCTLLISAPFFLSGCFLKANIGSLEKTFSETSISVTDPTFTLSLASNNVSKTTFDHEVNGFINVTLNTAADRVISVNLIPTSVDATSADFEIGESVINFQRGEITKTVNLIVKGNSGSKDFDKSVTITASIDDSLFKVKELSKTFTITDSNPLVLSVNNTYPTLGTLWNSYIQDPSAKVRIVSPYTRIKPAQFPIEATCTGDSCLHAGELKKVTISSRKTCNGLTMQDSEGAFEWRCEDSTPPVFFYSVGFKKGKGLKNLILTSGTDWKNLSVTAYDNSVSLGSSPLTKWWLNPVILFDSTNINSGGSDGRLALNVANTVYVFKGSLQSRGIDITADGVALVTLPGSSVTSTNPFASGDCDSTSGGVQLCFMNNAIKNRIWIEGTYTGLAAQTLYRMSSFGTRSRHVRFHGATLSTGSILVWIYYSASDSFTDSTFSNADSGIYTGANISSNYLDLNFLSTGLSIVTGNTGSNGHLFNIKIRGTNAVSSLGLSLEGLSLVASNVQVTNMETGISGSSVSALLINALASNNQTGINIVSTSTSLINTTAFSNLGQGITANKSFSKNFFQVLSTNNATGVTFAGSGSNIYDVRNSAFIDNSTNEIAFSNNVTNVSFKGNIMLGRNSTPCSIGTGTSSIGVTNSNCDTDGSGTFAVNRNLNANSIFQGLTNDTTNPQGANGVLGEAFGNITSWFSFDSFYRTWMPFTTSTIPTGTLRSGCSTGTCGIFDTKIIAGSHGLKNFNGTFVSNAACPAITKGSNAITYYNSNTGSAGLQGALEILFDGIGNDNGICESNEYCYFTPDIGANFIDVQSLNQTCIYDANGSTFTGITIYGKN